jgi:hypothetical protein
MAGTMWVVWTKTKMARKKQYKYGNPQLLICLEVRV